MVVMFAQLVKVLKTTELYALKGGIVCYVSGSSVRAISRNREKNWEQ